MISWTKEPKFELINDGLYDSFVCVSFGSVNLNGLVLVFQEGWITDMTTIPTYLQSIVQKIGPHSPAVIIHDLLLDSGFLRDEARYWLDEQLKMLDRVSFFKRKTIVTGIAVNDWCRKMLPWSVNPKIKRNILAS